MLSLNLFVVRLQETRPPSETTCAGTTKPFYFRHLVGLLKVLAWVEPPSLDIRALAGAGATTHGETCLTLCNQRYCVSMVEEEYAHMAYCCDESALDLLDPKVGFVFQLCSLGGPTSVKEDVEEMAGCVLSAVEALGSTRVIIGSTYADLEDEDNITTQGVAARWRQTYEPRGFTGLLVVGAVTNDEVVGCLAEYEMMPLELARLYERLVDEAIPEPLDHSREIAGGGRLGTRKREVGLVYAALGP